MTGGLKVEPLLAAGCPFSSMGEVLAAPHLREWDMIVKVKYLGRDAYKRGACPIKLSAPRPASANIVA